MRWKWKTRERKREYQGKKYENEFIRFDERTTRGGEGDNQRFRKRVELQKLGYSTVFVKALIHRRIVRINLNAIESEHSVYALIIHD